MTHRPAPLSGRSQCGGRLAGPAKAPDPFNPPPGRQQAPETNVPPGSRAALAESIGAVLTVNKCGYAEKQQYLLDVGEKGLNCADLLVWPSLPIVPFSLLNTTSRAADYFSFPVILGVADRVSTRFRRTGKDSALGKRLGPQKRGRRW